MLQIESYGVSSLEIWHRGLAAGYKSREEALKAAMGLRKNGLLPILLSGFLVFLLKNGWAINI